MKKITRMPALIHRLNPPRISRQRLLTLFTVLAVIGCENQTGLDAKSDQNPPPSVKIARPLAQDVTEWDEYTGRIEAVSSVDVRSRVSGYLEKVNFKAGDKVKKAICYS